MENYKDLLGMFHHLTMGSSDPEVAKGKPDPAIFLVCASRFPNNPKPEDVSRALSKYGPIYYFIEMIAKLQLTFSVSCI